MSIEIIVTSVQSAKANLSKKLACRLQVMRAHMNSLRCRLGRSSRTSRIHGHALSAVSSFLLMVNACSPAPEEHVGASVTQDQAEQNKAGKTLLLAQLVPHLREVVTETQEACQHRVTLPTVSNQEKSFWSSYTTGQWDQTFNVPTVALGNNLYGIPWATDQLVGVICEWADGWWRVVGEGFADLLEGLPPRKRQDVRVHMELLRDLVSSVKVDESPESFRGILRHEPSQDDPTQSVSTLEAAALVQNKILTDPALVPALDALLLNPSRLGRVGHLFAACSPMNSDASNVTDLLPSAGWAMLGFFTWEVQQKLRGYAPLPRRIIWAQPANEQMARSLASFGFGELKGGDQNPQFSWGLTSDQFDKCIRLSRIKIPTGNL